MLYRWRQQDIESDVQYRGLSPCISHVHDTSLTHDHNYVDGIQL